MDDLIQSPHLWLPELLVMLGLMLVSAFFSASETAIFYLSHDELRGFRVGRPRERLIAELLQDVDRLLMAVLFWNLVTNLSYFAVSIVATQSLTSGGHGVAAALFGVLSLCGIILFGEVVPKSLAVVFRRPLSTLVVWPLAVAVHIFDPISPHFRKLARLTRRTFWPHVTREPLLETDDLEQAVENSKHSKDVIVQERQVLHNILDLSEIPVEEVMRPRGTYATVSAPVGVRDLRQLDVSHEYLAMLREGTEDIQSAVVMAGHSSIPEENIEQIAEEVIHVPWCSNLAYTLQLMRDQFRNVASVVNEYGESIGIVTYEDIVDTILTPQPSRAKRLLHREPVLQVAPGRYHVEAITSLRYLCKRLTIDYEPTSDGQITVAGMLHEQLERIPAVGDECEWRGFRIRVIDLSERGKMRVMVSKLDL